MNFAVSNFLDLSRNGRIRSPNGALNVVEMGEQMKIFNLKIIKDNSEVKLSVSVESEQLGLKELWFSTTEKYAHGLCGNRLDGFLIGMIFPAMQYGEDIHLEGCVSKKLLFNLNNYVIPLLMVFSLIGL